MEVEEYVGTPLAADGSDLPSGTVPLSRLVTGDSPRLCGDNSSHARMLASLRDALNLVTPALLACLAALRLGHVAAFLPASIDHKLLEPPDSGTESWLPPRSASCSADQR